VLDSGIRTLPGTGTARGIIDSATQALTTAVRLGKEQSHDDPQSHYWLGRILQITHIDQAPSADLAKRRLTVKEFYAADQELNTALELAAKEKVTNSELSTYAIERAESLLLHPDFYSMNAKAKQAAVFEVSVRGKELQKLALPKTSTLDIDQEVNILNARAKLLADSPIEALKDLDAPAAQLRQSADYERVTRSDAKLMELRFKIYTQLRPDELPGERIEQWLLDAMWYAQLPRSVVNKDQSATAVLVAARTEAEKLTKAFAPFKADWLHSAIESFSLNLTRPKEPQVKNLQGWYGELIKLYDDQYASAYKSSPESSRKVAEQIAARLEGLINSLDRQRRKTETNQLRKMAEFMRNAAKPQVPAARKTTPAAAQPR
jgi:hypothetical protein